MYEQKNEEGEAGNAEHEAPEWGKLKSVIILIAATGFYALVAEAMTEAMTPAFDYIHVSEEFAGLTVIAVVTNIAEFANAVSFAMQNNITLSLEIGSVGAIQVGMFCTCY